MYVQVVSQSVMFTWMYKMEMFCHYSGCFFSSLMIFSFSVQ